VKATEKHVDKLWILFELFDFGSFLKGIFIAYMVSKLFLDKSAESLPEESVDILF
jgi:hypothetical protein